MEAMAIQSAEEDVRGFIEEYFASWTSADERTILAYYSEDIVLRVPTQGREFVSSSEPGI
jgi:ketosteroid isomerase-like protein